MADKLAKLAELKPMVGISSATTEDAFLTALLVRATGIASLLIGRPLMREVDRVEFPDHLPGHGRYCSLNLAPIESVSEVIQLYSTGTDDDFDVASSGGDALVLNEDFIIHDKMARLQRVSSLWVFGPRYLRVTYTGGWIDPDTVDPPATAIQPPEELQTGILHQAATWFNTKGKDGIKATGGGEKTKATTFHERDAHPLLVQACMGHKRLI